mmetsp:Transcript_13083/g.19253  ORF Transcript_13083/g.19253 Transcript_13083/m.19253 type:complete len:125 (-) Transcript_13083:119-493(-)
MKSVLSLLLAALIVVSTTAFGVHTPVFSKAATAARVTQGNNMEMRARICDLTGKRPNRQARVVTFSHKRIKKVQHVNLQKKKFYSEELGRNVKLRISTKGIKTVTKYNGIDAAAKKFGVDLSKF